MILFLVVLKVLYTLQLMIGPYLGKGGEKEVMSQGKFFYRQTPLL